MKSKPCPEGDPMSATMRYIVFGFPPIRELSERGQI